MDFLPVFLDLRGKRCLVVGGGAVAERKTSMLLRAGAAVEVVAPTIGEALTARAAAGEVAVTRRGFEPGDVAGALLVVAATGEHALNRRIAAAASAAGVYVNAVDQPDDSTLIMPSVVDRSPVVIAIGTGGNAPVLARLLRARLETLIPPAYGELARLLGSLRGRVKAAIPEQRARRAFWESILDGPAPELFFAGRREQALAAIETRLADPDAVTAPRGEVYLVGTGPGDPDLLTFRALRLMQVADVIVHDRLVSDAILDLCRRDAHRIYVGKAKSRHAVSQEDINSLLVNEARAGRRVARLKGGDPFMFGRGGEEIDTLAAAGIDFQVVPGITAALGCAAYAGIPLTHRDLAHSCVFVTGHQRDGRLDLDWSALTAARQTVVVYMGLTALPALCAGLVSHGMPATTPAAIVERATTSRQRVITGDLDSLPGRAVAAGCESPATVIIGAVVTLHDKLAWFDTGHARPAAG